MQWTISRRRFLAVSATLGAAWVTRGWWPKAAPAVARTLEQLGILATEVPTLIPMLVGESELPPEPTATPTPTETLTPTPSATPTPTSTPSPMWKIWLPWVGK